MSADGTPRARALEAFAGAGGAALGLHRAGFDHVACVEHDPDACATLAAAGFPAVCGDVRTYQPTETPDLLWASPPCQAWSSAGKRLGAADERNGWPWTFDLVDRAKPTWLVCENVPGLLHHKADCDGVDPLACPGCYWLGVILPAARERFACVSWATLDAADHGVPQRRHRVILVCGPAEIRWPDPTHSAAALALSKWTLGDYWRRHGIAPVGDPSKDERKLLRMLFPPGAGLRPWRTVRDALELSGTLESGSKCRRDADGIARGPLQIGTDRPCLAVDGTPHGVRSGPQSGRLLVPDAPADAIQAGSPTSNHAPLIFTAGVTGEGRPTSIDNPTGTIGGQGNQYLDQSRTLPLDAPAFTLRAQGNTDASGHMGGHASVFIPDPKHPPSVLDEPAGSVRSGGCGHSAPQSLLVVGIATAHGPGEPVSDRRLEDLTDRPARTVADMSGGVRGGGMGIAGSRPELLDEPSIVVTAADVKGCSSEGNVHKRNRASDGLYMGAGIRRLTVAECATLQDFPADHPWKGTKTAQYRQVGNAVPPTLAQVIGAAVIEAIARESG